MSGRSAPLNVLIAEDCADDAELMVRELRKAGLAPCVVRVETADAMAAALGERSWDVVLCDHRMPAFDSLTALRMVRATARDLPFIVVTGAIGEEAAVGMIQAGANDFVAKGNLGRLGYAVARAMRNATALRRSESLLEAVLRGISDGVVTTDQNGTVIRFSVGAERIFGYTAAEVIGGPVDHLIPEGLRPRHQAHQRAFLRSGGSARHLAAPGMLTGRRASGEEFPMEATISKVEVGAEAYATVVLRDVTVRERAAAVERERDILRETAQARSAFVSSLSHELRTPLNAILGFSKLLLEQLDPAPRHRAYLEHVYDAGRRLLSLVNDVLDIARMEAGRVELRPETISLRALLEPCLDSAVLAAEARGVTFTTAHPDAVLLSLDPMRARQIVDNLLSNAVKFTPAGGQVSLAVRAENGGLAFEVADTGAGIPLDSQERVFGAFERLHEGVLAESGTGLGLALTKQLVVLHGGTIGFESRAGVGTTFRVFLPRTLVSPVPVASGAGNGPADRPLLQESA
jgi:PAS domain S-box-containing protein